MTAFEITTTDTLSVRDIEEFLAIYRAAFDAVIYTSPCRQCFTDDEFREEMGDPSVVKFVMREPDDERPVAMAFVSTDISSLTWLEPRYFERKYPQQYHDGRIYYIGAMLVRPDRQRSPAAVRLVAYIVDYVASRHGVAAFDCSDFRAESGFPALISRVTAERALADEEPVRTQLYYAYVSHGNKPGIDPLA